MINIKLQIKITVLFITILGVSIAGVYFYYLPQIEENMEDEASENLKNIALNTAVFLEHLIDNEQRKIAVLANNAVIQSNQSTIKEKLHELNVYGQQYQTYDEITLIDIEGNVEASTNYNYRGDWKTKTWYQHALNGNVTVSDAHIILNPWKLVILFLAPVMDTNESITGVVAGQIELDHYWKILDNITVGETGFIRIVNNEGRILYHANRSKVFSMISEDNPLYATINHKTMKPYYIEECDKTYLGLCTPLLGNTIYGGSGSWFLLATQERAEVFSSLSDFKINLIISSVIFSIFLAILGYFVSKSIVNPIMNLDKGMKDVANGNLNYSIDFKSRDELNTLTKSFNQMVKKLAELTQKVEDRNQLVEKLLKQKNEFINQLSHDLKNPLGPFINLLPILIKTEKDPKKKRILTVLERNAGYMKNLVINTIELAKLNSPDTKFNFQLLKLNEIVNQIYSDVKLLLNEKNIQLENNIPENISVYADELRINELFKNIVSNSVKYSHNNGKISINAEKGDEAVLVSISDTGIGMSEDQLEHIFDEYYKADGSRHDFDSTGLGMSICQRIVEKHNGKIWAESDGLRKGSTLYFTLPFNQQNNNEEIFYKSNTYDEISNSVDKLLLR